MIYSKTLPGISVIGANLTILFMHGDSYGTIETPR